MRYSGLNIGEDKDRVALNAACPGLQVYITREQCLAAGPQVPGSIPGAARFPE
jgi:hypothetical protein